MTKIKFIEKDFYPLTGNGKIGSFSGRPKGQKLREEWGLDELEKEKQIIVLIKVPEFIYNLGPSFIQGLFTKTIFVENGKENFYKKYVFEATPLITAQIDFVIDKLHREKEKGRNSNALD